VTDSIVCADAAAAFLLPRRQPCVYSLFVRVTVVCKADPPAPRPSGHAQIPYLTFWEVVHYWFHAACEVLVANDYTRKIGERCVRKRGRGRERAEADAEDSARRFVVVGRTGRLVKVASFRGNTGDDSVSEYASVLVAERFRDVGADVRVALMDH